MITPDELTKIDEMSEEDRKEFMRNLVTLSKPNRATRRQRAKKPKTKVEHLGRVTKKVVDE